VKSTINKSAQEVIDRLKAINYDEPYWNEAEVIKAFEKQSELLGTKMPEIQIADNMLIGFELAWDAAWGAAWDAARGAAWGAARGAARDAARDAAWDAAWDAARDAASRNTGLTDEATIKWIQISDQELKALENGLGYFFPMRDKLILVPMPRMILNGDRLHFDHGKAVEWKDGKGFYFLRGVQFGEKLYNKIVNFELTAEETLKIGNADQRAAAISMLRPDRLLNMLGAKHINTGTKGTKLYEVKNFMDTSRTEYCMWMQDASTDREFIEWVEPKVAKQGDADLCQAAAFGIPLEDYLGMELEA